MNEDPRGESAASLALLNARSLAGLDLRNGVIKSATYEGMTPQGMPSPALTQHHVDIARGGAGMSTLAYASVHESGRTFADQLVVSAKTRAPLRELTDAVHEAGAAMSVQLAHCGGFSKDLAHKARQPKGPQGPSRALNLYGMLSGLVWTQPMRDTDIRAVVDHFARAAAEAVAAGFDAIELHLGHGYLLSQFISPAINKRDDTYGGSLANRMRLPLEVIQAVRKQVGDGFPLLAKTNLRDAIAGGLELDEAVEVARMLEAQPRGVDALVLSGGIVSRSAFYLLRGGRPLKAMVEVEKSRAQRLALRLFGPMVIEKVPFEDLFFLPLAKVVRAAVRMPLVLLGGVVAHENFVRAHEEGFEFVAVGRAFIENPNFVNDLAAGRVLRSKCDHCNACVAEMDRGGLRCVLHPPRVPIQAG